MAFIFLFCSIHKPGIELCLSMITRLHAHCNEKEDVTPDEDDDDDDDDDDASLEKQ
jgi:hypothetical protein